MPPINFNRTNLPKGSASFFATFARFEFALKDCKFLHVDKRGGVHADWDAFAGQLPGDFFVSIVNSGKAHTLISKPPKKQVVVGNSLDFSPQRRPVNAVELFIAVRRVRNNLFHGGKAGDPEGNQRNEALIAEAQWILEHALHAHDEVRYVFEGQY